MVTKKWLCAILLTCAVTHAAFAADVWQWRGEQRNGFYPETDLLKVWDKEGLKLLWQNADVGTGYSSPIAVGEKIYLTGKIGNNEFLTALDKQGKKLWQTQYGGVAKSYSDTRTAPTFIDGKLYVISGDGTVAAIDAAGGELLWSVAAFKNFGGQAGNWGVAESPLVVDDLVFCTVGGDETTLVALNRHTGETVWKTPSLKSKAAYVSPIVIEYGGKKQIIGVVGKYIFAVDAADGKILWTVDYVALPEKVEKSGMREINCNTPLYHDGKIFVTSGYNHCAVLLQLNAQPTTAPKIVWTNDDLDTHHGGVVLLNGCLYGSNWDNSNEKGNWVCVDWQTGKTQYETTWKVGDAVCGKGSIITADGKLYCYDEKRGNLALVAADAQKFSVISSFPITAGSGQHWCHPIISNGVLYLRRGNVLMAYSVK